MKILHLILFISIFSLSSLADEYILITKTSNRAYLSEIHSKLKEIDVKMHIKEDKSSYFIYSGLYLKKESLDKALKNIKRYFPHAYVVAKREELQETKEEKKSVEVQKRDSYFFGLALAYGKIGGDTGDLSASKIDNSYLSYSVEGGYYLSENIYTSLIYLNASSDDIRVDNIMVTINYKVNIVKDLDIFGGLLAGLSNLQLSEFKDSTASSSALFGAQFGAVYNFYGAFDIYTSYQGIYMEHIINLEDTTSSIKFDSIHNIQLGLLYKF